MFGVKQCKCLLIFHFLLSQGDLKFFAFSGACLHRSHFLHLKYPFSSLGPLSANLFGTVGFKISPIFFNLLFDGIIEPSGNIFSHTGSEYSMFLYPWIIGPLGGTLGSHLEVHADTCFLFDFFSSKINFFLSSFFAFKN